MAARTIRTTALPCRSARKGPAVPLRHHVDAEHARGQRQSVSDEGLLASGNHNNVARLQQLGFQPKRPDLSNNNPQREAAARFTRVVEIVEHEEIADVVYCFTENKRHMGCFGILTGQCGEQPLRPTARVCWLINQRR